MRVPTSVGAEYHCLLHREAVRLECGEIIPYRIQNRLFKHRSISVIQDTQAFATDHYPNSSTSRRA